MTDDLLPYYQQELAWFRRFAAEFAESHPKIAGRLKLGADAIEDPHVARLVESFALLTSRVRRKLDDDFPELSQALLGVLYPHYLAPVPSSAVVQMQGAPDQAEPFDVAAGSQIETVASEGDPCRFRTSYPVRVWPFDVEAAQLTGRPLVAPKSPVAGAVASVRIALRARSAGASFARLRPGSLRFFLQGPADQANALYELLLNDALGVALADGPEDAAAVHLPASCLRPVGFGRDETIYPLPPTAFVGYGLLTEYFAFPAKFLFFDLADLPPAALSRFTDRLEIYVYLRREGGGLEPYVQPATFALGCTPVVNLFRMHAEPIPLTRTTTEVRVVPDSRRPLSTEVWSVDAVHAVSRRGDREPCRPFFSARHGAEPPQTRWYATQRRPADRAEGRVVPGTDVTLTLLDLDVRPDVPADHVLDVEVTCLSRDLPARLPYGGDQPRLKLQGGAPVRVLRCMTRPTPTRRPPLGQGLLWRLVSHLSLNHLSITGGHSAERAAEGTEALREILRLYDFVANEESRAAAEGLVLVTSAPATARLRGPGPGAIARGTDVRVELDPAKFSGGGVFLFASVLERFFAAYTTVNSFTRTTVTLRGREGELRRWPPRAGETPLV